MVLCSKEASDTKKFIEEVECHPAFELCHVTNAWPYKESVVVVVASSTFI
jgi:hypothetical protein